MTTPSWNHKNSLYRVLDDLQESYLEGLYVWQFEEWSIIVHSLFKVDWICALGWYLPLPHARSFFGNTCSLETIKVVGTVLGGLHRPYNQSRTSQSEYSSCQRIAGWKQGLGTAKICRRLPRPTSSGERAILRINQWLIGREQPQKGS